MSRLEKLRKVMAENHLDAYIVMSPENRRYLSGFTGTSATLLILPHKAYLLTDFRYIEQATAQAPDYEIVKVGSDGLKTLKDLVLDAEQIGFEGDSITYTDYVALKDVFPLVKLVSASYLINTLRSVKDAEEIKLIRRAVEIADQSFTHIRKILKAGQTEEEISTELEFAMRKQGASGRSFDFIVASGRRAAMPHGVATTKRIQAGELLTMDFGAIYQGYCSDITRTVCLGHADEKQRKIYDLVLKANELGIKTVAPGKTGKEVDAVVRQFLADAGYGAYFGHGLGHSVGLAIHEGPNLNTREERVLEPGMVVTIEPGVYLPDWSGVRIEDMVLVTEGGCQVLTQSPKEFIIIE